MSVPSGAFPNEGSVDFTVTAQSTQFRVEAQIQVHFVG